LTGVEVYLYILLTTAIGPQFDMTVTVSAKKKRRLGRMTSGCQRFLKLIIELTMK